MEDRNMPATKADLEALEARQNERLEILRSEMQHSHQNLNETIRDVETKLLKAFYSFGESNNKRVMELEGNEAAIRSRLGTLEDRLLEVEKRLNMPHTQ